MVELIVAPVFFWGGALLSIAFLEVARTLPYRHEAIVWLFGGVFVGPIFVLTAVSGYNYSPLWGEYGAYVFIFWLFIFPIGIRIILRTKPEENTKPTATDENSH